MQKRGQVNTTGKSRQSLVNTSKQPQKPATDARKVTADGRSVSQWRGSSVEPVRIVTGSHCPTHAASKVSSRNH
jgi:hypothetical protein